MNEDLKKNRIWMIAFFMSMYFLFQMISVCEEADIMEKDKQIIEEFMKKIIHTDVKKIEYMGGPEKEKRKFLLPSRACINFRGYKVNYMKDRFANPNTGSYEEWYQVWIAEGEDKVFSYLNMPQECSGRSKQSKLLSTQEILESAKPLFEYLGIQGECKDLSAPIIKEMKYDPEIRITRTALLNGVPCRYKGLDLIISRLDGKITKFLMTPPVIPKNRKPQEECPKDKVLSIAKDWLENIFSNTKYYINPQLKAENKQDVMLVIAPAFNIFDDSDKRWKDLNFYYAWEIPFLFYELMQCIDCPPEKGEGVIWIDAQSYEVIGAGRNIRADWDYKKEK